MEWKWTYGENYEKSPRIQKQVRHIEASIEAESFENIKHRTAHMAQQQSLLSENDVWSLDEPMSSMEMALDKPLNKREDTYNKISEREMMGQMGRNPFMMENNYLHDVITQDDFLKPISTTGEREKHHIPSAGAYGI